MSSTTAPGDFPPLLDEQTDFNGATKRDAKRRGKRVNVVRFLTGPFNVNEIRALFFHPITDDIF